MSTAEPMGFPPHVAAFAGIDLLGSGCRIADSVSVFRAVNRFGDAGIFLGDEVTLFDGVRLLLGEIDARLVMGDRVIVNVGAYLSGEGGLVIEDDVMIGPRANLLSAGHGIHGGDAVIARNPITYGSIRVGRGAWIAASATVLPGVTIGEGAVVAAGSVVTAHVPAFAVVAGNPARVVRVREGYASAPGRRWWSFAKAGR